MTQSIILATGAFFGMLSVIFGAFGAHALKKNTICRPITKF
ncbi:hypothetical protein JCM19300_1112 [Algibacter lectus]|uniref:DUF423 domain-containing protein n=1 Tax=Algibacter lectus TaxID=221126 RepID=A0A090VIC0_9FLAO|nr:hypothetical protein JCM19300_1112 [Algibacter lectus]